MNTEINIIMCLDNDGGFSKNNKIPWFDENGKNKYPEDMKYFNKITKNNVCVMGKNTYNEILALNKLNNREIKDEILPNRKNYVLSRNGNFDIIGIEHVVSLRDIFEKEMGKKIFILGGEKLVIEALPISSQIYLTVLKENYNCDKFFPLDYLQKNFNIKNGDEKENLYFINYVRKMKI